MPEKKIMQRAQRAKRAGKSPSTQAGEFVREEIRHIREGKHGARNTKQAIAIGLSKARRAGVDLSPPEKGKTSEKTRRAARRDHARGQASSGRSKPSEKRSNASLRALKREGASAASHTKLSKHAHDAARRKTAGERSVAAHKASETKGPSKRREAARKAARTRARNA